MHSIQDVKPLTASQPAVLPKVSHLHIQQQQQVLLHDLNFELHAGETIALVGESGSGKSISSLALLGLLPEHLQVQGQPSLRNKIYFALNRNNYDKFEVKNCHDFFRNR